MDKVPDGHLWLKTQTEKKYCVAASLPLLGHHEVLDVLKLLPEINKTTREQEKTLIR